MYLKALIVFIDKIANFPIRSLSISINFGRPRHRDDAGQPFTSSTIFAKENSAHRDLSNSFQSQIIILKHPPLAQGIKQPLLAQLKKK